jgi:hypothetical protein
LTDVDLAAIDAAAAHLAGPAAATLATSCPRCDADVRVAIDVGALLWERVSTAAQHLLVEIATLARAFGWSEDDVLALTPARRSAYLALAADHAEPRRRV